MRFLVGESREEVVKDLPLDEFPELLAKNNLWMNFSIIDDKQADISVVSSLYDSNVVKKPEDDSWIFVSNKIYNSFPVAQSVWSTNHNINRMYTDPKYRDQKNTINAVKVNNFVAKELGYNVWSIIYAKDGGTKLGDQLYNTIYDLGFKKESVKIDLDDIFQYRNYCYPVMYMDKRLVYREDSK